ncbi:MAG: homocysteine S-methyltransferase family protein [Clostridia bacterium]|nr:homocysteine S-methyltransferase family protein [Clostridia bacterium]
MPDHTVLLDGAMGTMLQKMGMKPGETPEIMNLEKPEWILSIHRAYIRAGSQIIYANTFGANRRKLRRAGGNAKEIITAGVKLAKEAARETGAKTALDVGPIGELLEPMGALTFEEAYDVFAEMMEAGAAAGADLIVIETMTDLYEAKAALLAAKEKTSLPVFVTMSFDAAGRTFTGCTVASMAHTLTGLGADAIGINCSLGPKELLPLARELRRHTHLPLIVKPNAGLPDPVDGHYDLSAGEFALAMGDLIRAGAVFAGGCCGTDPEYIGALKAVLLETKAETFSEDIPALVCTPTTALTLDRVRVIGERINPTGKKRFQQALLENDMDYIVDVAIQQIDAGAELLDVNVGYPGVDEAVMLPRVVKALQAAVDVPLQLDSANPAALEAALRAYNGKAAVNSVSGKEESLNTVLPIVKKYGAAVVGLALDDEGLPDSAEKRLAIGEKIMIRAAALGIPKRDVWIDCLTLTVSAQQDQAEETLKAVSLVREKLGLQTVLGVSNISFGLPNRLLMTQTFLIRALHAGLTLPIVNPNQKEIMDAIAAFRVLNGEDQESKNYVARFSQAQMEAKPASASAAQMTLDEAIIRGLKTEAGRIAREALRDQPPLSLVDGHLIPALDRVGADYERGAAFLPQLLSAAQAAQAVFEEIRAVMAAQGGETVSKGKIIIATVQGDIHDIGKNIVKTVLQNYGYTVLDLGKDVPPETVVRAAQEENIRLVGLSALMTTTLPAMEETVRQLRQLKTPPQVMVGGAVVTADYARAMGADFYAKDARAAVEIARKVFGS